MFIHGVLIPSNYFQTRFTEATIFSIICSVIYCIISYILFYLHYNVSERIERVLKFYSFYFIETTKEISCFWKVTSTTSFKFTNTYGRNTYGRYGCNERTCFC